MTQFMDSQRLPAIDLTTSPMVKSIDNEDNEWPTFGTIAHSFGRNK